jgi:hypothetical protein
MSCGNLFLRRVDRLHGLVDRQRGLGEPDHLGGVAHLDLGDVLGAVDERDVLGGLAGRADDFLVALVPDQEDVVVLLGEADGFLVDLGDQRAGRVDGGELAGRGLVVDDRGDAVRREHDDGPLGDLRRPLDEDRTLLFQGLHDELVVDDFVADIDRGPVLLQGLLDGDHGTVDSRAIATGGGEEDTAASRSSHASHRKAAPGGSKITALGRLAGSSGTGGARERLRRAWRSARRRGSSPQGSGAWGCAGWWGLSAQFPAPLKACWRPGLAFRGAGNCALNPPLPAPAQRAPTRYNPRPLCHSLRLRSPYGSQHVRGRPHPRR